MGRYVFKQLSVPYLNNYTKIKNGCLNCISRFQLFSTSHNEQSILCSGKDGNSSVYTVLLNSPATRNALSLCMINSIRENLDKCISNKDVSCLVIRGNGHAFSAGHNLKEMTSADGNEHHKAIFQDFNKLMEQIIKYPVPVIAAVDGVAAAAGCQLAAVCDIVVATERSSFSVPGINVGIFCSTPGVVLSRMVPRKVSSYMLLTGNPLNAVEAYQAGLVSRIVGQSHDLDNEIRIICEAIESKPRAVLKLGKLFFQRQIEMNDMIEALKKGAEVMADNLKYSDAQEGIEAFKDKRKPEWSNTDRKTFDKF